MVHDRTHFLAGNGEMALRMRDFDWSKTALGPPKRWPQSLRSAVSILIPSKAQIVLFWGPDLVTLYNDAYRPVFGRKHPGALGLPAREAWSEIWDTGLRALLEGVLTTGEAFWASDRLFVLERLGYSEETYFDVSYDPVRGETGAVDGVFCIVSETTGRVLNERRLKTLRELAMRTTEGARSVEAACANAAQIFATNPFDLPFTLIYLYDAEAGVARLAGSSGLQDDSPAAPKEIDLGTTSGSLAAPWPLGEVLETRAPAVVTEPMEALGLLPSTGWPEPPTEAVVLPIIKTGQSRLAGFLVAGVNPRRRLDEQYHAFLDLLANQMATAVASARAYEEERRRAEALADLDRAKTAFFSNVSHEFRTPLTLMLGPVEELLGNSHADLSAPAKSQLEVVSRNGLRLLRLVNTLLDFSRIEAGRVRASFQPTDLAAFTAELASVFRAAIERAGVRLLVSCGPLPAPIFVDRDMWEKVVLNLLSNALKFTFAGEIEVGLRHPPGSNHVELRVRDTGTGIPAAEIPRLFERFHRVANAQGRTHEGSGIGLALVQELVKFHGGTVTAESVVGRGTTFMVTVPMGSTHLPTDQIAESRPLASTSTTAAPFLEEASRWLPDEQGLAVAVGSELAPDYETLALLAPSDVTQLDSARPLVLVADDNADMRRYLVHLLEERYRVVAVADGQAALESVRSKAPELVLTDVMMPRLDGFGLLRALRDDPATRELPVIMLSARAGEESRVEGLDAGADDYLIKPFSARELLARVQSSLTLSRVRRAAERELREADLRKNEFLATLSHELRNPLAPLRNTLEIMKRADAGSELLDQARATMERQLSSLVRLVDDLLDVSRITRNNLELRTQRVELASVIHHALETCRPLAEDFEHELIVELPPEPIYLDADPVRLAQVFSNLCHNACKYSERRGRVEVKAVRDGDEVVLSVKDQGLGIPAEQLERIFEMFAQVDSTLERSRGGLGIGLTLAKRLVEMHGGTITAHSEGRGRGSEFVVRLPILAAETVVAVAGSPTIDGAPASARRILVVDDNPDAAGSLAELLRMTGNETHVANDGLAAIEAADRLRPEVILLDIGLPKLNGYDVCRRIRAHLWGRQVAMVALTGWGQEEDRNRSREAGFDGHLVKPVDYRALMELLDSLLPHRPTSVTRSSSTSAPNPL
jgi:signal transduction histidine kinase